MGWHGFDDVGRWIVMLYLEVIDCKPLRKGNEWKLIAVMFGIGFLLGAACAVAINCSI